MVLATDRLIKTRAQVQTLIADGDLEYAFRYIITNGAGGSKKLLVTPTAVDAISSFVVNLTDATVGTYNITTDTFTVETGGTYTPTLTNDGNITASTAYLSMYSRQGNIISVHGQVDITPTLATTGTDLFISLPVASAITNDYEVAGHGISYGAEAHGNIVGETAGNQAHLRFKSSTVVTSQRWSFEFTYQVL